MKCYGLIVVPMSDALKSFIESKFITSERFPFQIQDVQEWLEPGDPLAAEIDELRRAHGNFWLENDRK